MIDLASKRLISWKLFVIEGRGTIRPRYVVREVQKELGKLQLEMSFNKEEDGELGSSERQVILHSDRGPEFCSKEYHEIFKRFPFTIGSMSESRSPNQNAVAERFARTIKFQLKKAPPIPQKVKNLNELAKIVERRVEVYNEKHKPKLNLKRSPNSLEKALIAYREKAPESVVHWPQQTYFKPKDKISFEIDKFKKAAIAEFERRNPYKVLLDTESAVAMSNSKIDAVSGQIELFKQEMFAQLETIRNEMKKSNNRVNRIRRVEKPLREPAGSPIYEYLLALQKDPKASSRVWARNRIVITLLRYLGVRASELMQLTYTDLQEALIKGTMQIWQPKTKSYRLIVLAEGLLKQLRKQQDDIKKAFIGQDAPLGISIAKRKVNKENGLMYSTNWRKSLNRFIRKANEAYPGVYTSHSFRINLVTRLLRTVPLVEVKSIIGHKSVATTERYFRYQPKGDQLKKTIDIALEEDSYQNDQNE
jgi:integrase